MAFESPDPEARRLNVSAPSLALFSTGLVFLAFILVGSIMQIVNPAFGLWFSEVYVFLGVSWILLRLMGERPAQAAGLVPVARAELGVGFLVGAANFFAAVVPIQYLAL